MLGLGLGLSKGSTLLSNLKLLTRNSDFAFWIDKATGTSKGTNSPQVNPIVDLVGVVGKNLLDEINLIGTGSGSGTCSMNANGTYKYVQTTTQISNGRASSGILNPNTTYTLKLSNVIKTTGAGVLVFVERNSSNATINIFYADTQEAKVTFTTSPSATNYFMYITSNAQNTICDFSFNAQLELGTTATAYEPYGKSNGLLTGFGFIPTSGYADVVAPNGKTVTMVKFDAVNDYIAVSNNPSVDIVGTVDFAIAAVIKSSSLFNGYLICKNGLSSAEIQYGVLFADNSDLSIVLNGVNIGVVSNYVPNTFHKILIVRKSGVLKVYNNGTLTYNQPNTANLISRANVRVGARSNSADGTVNTAFFNANLGALKIINGAITPFTEAQLIKDWDSFCSKIYGL